MSRKTMLKRRLHVLKVLKVIPSQYRRMMVDLIDDSCIDIICESCYNLLNNLELSKKDKKRVRTKFLNAENKLRMVANPLVPLKKKRNILKDEQVGNGIFTVLASIIIPSIISAIASK